MLWQKVPALLVPVVRPASTRRSAWRLTARVPAMKVISASATIVVSTWATLGLMRMKLAQTLSAAVHIATDMTVTSIATSKDRLRLRRNDGNRCHVNRRVTGIILIPRIARRFIILIAIG